MELVEHLRKERQVRNVLRVSAPGRVDELTAGQDSGVEFPATQTAIPTHL